MAVPKKLEPLLPFFLSLLPSEDFTDKAHRRGRAPADRLLFNIDRRSTKLGHLLGFSQCCCGRNIVPRIEGIWLVILKKVFEVSENIKLIKGGVKVGFHNKMGPFR